MLDRNALTVIDGDARISCRHLSEVLGFARIDVLHRLIRAHEDELRDFGEVFHFEAENPSRRGGRPVKGYYLNEHQATAVCMWAETPKARAGRKLMVEVFTAWRKGQLPDMPAPAVDPSPQEEGGRMMADHFDWEAICSRAIKAQDVYAEIPKIIADLRAENIRRGGDDRMFGAMIGAQLGRISLPCLKEAPQ